MVNTTDICRIAISIGILMTLSSSVPQTTRKKVSFETVYADRVENVYSDRVGKVNTDRFALSPSQPSREANRSSYVARDGVVISCDARGDCIRPCGGATCAVLVFPQGPRAVQPAQGR
jgi:hypothetical protein